MSESLSIPVSASGNPSPIPGEFISLDNDLRFIKVRRHSKVPAESDWQGSNNYDANNPDLIRWISTGGNYGYFLNDDTDLCVLDADKPDELTELINYLGDTLTVKSGRTGIGFHILFRCENLGRQKIYLKNSEGNDVGDIRPGATEKKYQTIGPGSIHPDTCRPYEIVNHSTPVEVDRDELLKVISKYLVEKPSSHPIIHNGQKIKKTHTGRKAGVPIGERNNYLFSYACWLRSRGYGLSDILTTMIGINREDCIPPVDADELESVCKSACRYQAGAKEESKDKVIPGMAIIRKYAFKKLMKSVKGMS